MKPTTETIVMLDSPEAAQYRTDISGWVSRGGVYFGNDEFSELAARRAGCTHMLCRSCGATPTPEHYPVCPACSAAAERTWYDSLPRAEWDGQALLYSEVQDRYYTSPGNATESLGAGKTLADLRLTICTPNYASPIVPDYFADKIDADGELPDEIYDAMEAFNQAADGIVLSWSPGQTALALPAETSLPAGRSGATT